MYNNDVQGGRRLKQDRKGDDGVLVRRHLDLGDGGVLGALLARATHLLPPLLEGPDGVGHQLAIQLLQHRMLLSQTETRSGEISGITKRKVNKC